MVPDRKGNSISSNTVFSSFANFRRFPAPFAIHSLLYLLKTPMRFPLFKTVSAALLCLLEPRFSAQASETSAFLPEILFIDGAVADQEAITTAVRRGVEVIKLNDHTGALNQINKVLSSRHGITALHLVTHGEPGALLLGSLKLDTAAISKQRDMFISWRSSLAPDADLLLYGCEVGADSSGAHFMHELASVTGMSVAASIDLTGAKVEGGDWILEKSTQKIRTSVAFEADFEYNHVLPITRTESYQFDLWVRPGEPSYTWNFGTYKDGNNVIRNISKASYGNHSGFEWFLNRGRFQYSTNGGGLWVNYTINDSNNPIYINTASTLFRFVDDSPSDTVNDDRVGHWLYMTDPSGEIPIGGSGTAIRLDNPPTDITSADLKNLLVTVTSGTKVGTLTPTDTGPVTGGQWRITSQTVPNLFTIHHDNTIDNKATLKIGTGIVPADGVTASVTACYYDQYDTDASGNPVPGDGFSKTFTYTFRSDSVVDPRFSNESVANTYLTDAQDYQSITTLSNGNYVVVWQSNGQEKSGSSTGIYAQVYSPAGVKIGVEKKIANTNALDGEYYPRVSARAGGAYAVVYNYYDGYQTDVALRLIGADGSVSHQIIVNTLVGWQDYPDIATLTDGSLLVVWGDSNNGDLIMRRVSGTDGTLLDAEEVFAEAVGYQPKIVALNNGGYVLGWIDSLNNPGGFIKVGLTASTVTQDEINLGITDVGFLNFAALGNGFIVVTDFYSATPNSAEIRAFRYNNAGVAQGISTKVNTNTAGDRHYPAAAGLSDGGYVILWQSDTDDFFPNGVFGRRYQADGTPIDAEEFIVNQSRGGDQNSPAVTRLANGGFAAAWTDYTALNTEVETRVFLGASLTAPAVAATPTRASITTTSATLGGEVTGDGGDTVTERGVVYSVTGTNSDPLINGNGVTKLTATGTTGVFTASATGLTAATDYTFKAYATNLQGTTYSSADSFSTLQLPPLFTSYTTNTKRGKALSVALTKVLARATDPYGGAVTLTQVFSPTTRGGTVALSGSITYSPSPTFIGTDIIEFELTGSTGGTLRTSITVIVTDSSPATDNLTLLNRHDGVVDLVFRGIPGRLYSIERSPDLTIWTVIGSCAAGTDGRIPFSDPSPLSPQGFYRTQN